MQLSFFGAAGTVTGSRYLLSTHSQQLLIDCGLYQGYKQLRLKNWSKLPFEPRDIDAVLLTHAHIDHSGFIPALVKGGFCGRVYATAATCKLCEILLPDSGYLQEEQARFANRSGFSKHSPALPLYTKQDAEYSLERFEPIDFQQTLELPGDVRVRFRPAGHLLGAASILVSSPQTSVLFSGDLGRNDDILMYPPADPPEADYVVIESTYGDRVHPPIDSAEEFARAVRRVCKRNGVMVVPTFAIGRAQQLLLLLARAKAAGAIPDVPVYLDSPMAIDATPLFERFAREHRATREECAAAFRAAKLLHTSEQSKLLNTVAGPMIILAASGMATGGRVVHHLKRLAPDPANMILLAGFQAGGTRGAVLAAGARTIRIHGQEVPVNAEVVQLSNVSGHADSNGLLQWLGKLPRPPRRVFITHGEPLASDALRQRIESELRFDAVVPEYRDSATLA